MLNYKIDFHCFHGTTKESLDKIINNKKFEYEYRDNHWIGNGIYFFINDEGKGRWWAGNTVKKKAKEGIVAEPSVLYMLIKIERQRLLDLNTEEGQEKLLKFIRYLKSEKRGIIIKKRTNEDEENLKRRILCKHLDLMVKVDKYQATLYQFANENKSYLFNEMRIYGIMNNCGNQLCVYDETLLDFANYAVV
jgi:hypothetical protein